MVQSIFRGSFIPSGLDSFSIGNDEFKCLEEEGIEYIFGVPGEENADIMISLLDSKIRFVVCRHEQGAAFMADAIGRLSGKAAVCFGTLGKSLQINKTYRKI